LHVGDDVQASERLQLVSQVDEQEFQKSFRPFPSLDRFGAFAFGVEGQDGQGHSDGEDGGDADLQPAEAPLDVALFQLVEADPNMRPGASAWRSAYRHHPAERPPRAAPPAKGGREALSLVAGVRFAVHDKGKHPVGPFKRWKVSISLSTHCDRAAWREQTTMR